MKIRTDAIYGGKIIPECYLLVQGCLESGNAMGRDLSLHGLSFFIFEVIRGLPEMQGSYFMMVFCGNQSLSFRQDFDQFVRMVGNDAINAPVYEPLQFFLGVDGINVYLHSCFMNLGDFALGQI